jgi:signal transduction histidine kinase
MVATSADDVVGQAWFQLWREQATWQIRLRWLVPPLILACVVVGRGLGYQFEAMPIAAIAIAILGYNAALYVTLRSGREEQSWDASAARRLDLLQVALDYSAMFLLVFFTGGVASPLLFFFVIHVVFAAMLFRPPVAIALALVVIVGMTGLAVAEYAGWIAQHLVAYDGEAIVTLPPPTQMFPVLVFFGASILAVATTTATVAERLRRANARAFEAEQALIVERSQFMLKVAHNIRAPLAAAASMVDLLRQGYLGALSADQQAYLDRIHRRLQDASDTIGELLLLARSRERLAQLSPIEVDLAQIVLRVEHTFHDHAVHGAVGLHVDVPNDLPKLAGDPSLLEQLLENLVSNAIKYTPAGGEVNVAVSPTTGGVQIEVRDTGIGIPLEEQSRLYGEFFRASNARRIQATGTGLGLAIVRQIVDQHHGSIWFESEVDRGTRFVVELPRFSPAGV